jgi:flagellar hook assembly protein FlgD
MTVPSFDPANEYGFFKGGTGNPLSLGYHEVWWDGRDDSGIEVANGAYFYRLRVKTKDDSRELTGKFARVR